jgi:hypothetical protein
MQLADGNSVLAAGYIISTNIPVWFVSVVVTTTEIRFWGVSVHATTKMIYR